MSNPKGEINLFVTGVWDSIEEEYRATMFHDNTSISHLMVHAQLIEETRLRENIVMHRQKGLVMEVPPRANMIQKKPRLEGF